MSAACKVGLWSSFGHQNHPNYFFGGLTHDQQLRAATDPGAILVKDLGSDQLMVLSAADYREKWQPAAAAWAAEHGTFLRVDVFSENPNQVTTNGLGGQQDDPQRQTPATAQGTGTPSTAGESLDRNATEGNAEGGNGNTSAGSQGSKRVAGPGVGNGDAGTERHRGTGTSVGGDGSGAGLTGFGTVDSEEYGDTFGGERGGHAGGTLGGTPFSEGHALGSAGLALEGPVGTGAGTGKSARSTTSGVTGLGKRELNGQDIGYTPGNGDGRRIAKAPAASQPPQGPAVGPNSTLGQANGGAKQDAQAGQKSNERKGSHQSTKPPNDALDRASELAGYINNLGSSRPREGGADHGQPGSIGLLNINLGRFGQLVSIVLAISTIISLIGMIRSLLRNGIRLLLRRALARLRAFLRAFRPRGLLLRLRRFFWDPQPFTKISKDYWDRLSGLGRSDGWQLHHWLFPQKAKWIPLGLRNAGFNLIEINGRLNWWMGFAQRWGWYNSLKAQLTEWAIRLSIPTVATAAGYTGYQAGRSITDSDE